MNKSKNEVDSFNIQVTLLFLGIITSIHVAIFCLNIIYPYMITFKYHPWETILV